MKKKSGTRIPGKPPKPVYALSSVANPANIATGSVADDDAPRVHPTGQPAVDLRRGDDARRVDAEEQPELFRRHVEDFDEHERRTGDVGQQPREHEATGQHIAQVGPIAEQLTVDRQDDAEQAAAGDVRARDSRGRNSATTTATTSAVHGQDPEHRPPAEVDEQLTADRGGQDRRERPSPASASTTCATDSRSSKWSRTTARGMTSGAQPPRACRKRNAISDSTFHASAQPTDAAMNTASPR